jgi:RimJ/RimL family protein N-acetyltransferase
LGERHRKRIQTHLMSLEPHARYLRFGYAATDAQVERYVNSLDFTRDDVFGIFNRRLELIAMSHLAYLPQMPGERPSAEFGVSVMPKARGRGLGARMFDHSVLHARNRDVDTLIIHALTENTAMMRIAYKSGAKVVREGADAEARLKLPPYTVGSQLEAMVEDGAAEFDYHLKRQVKKVDALLSLLSELRGGDKTHHPHAE